MANPGYAAIGVYMAGSDKLTLMSVGGKVVIFDTPEVARQFVPKIGGGRRTSWRDRDTVCWFPIDKAGINRAVILTGYDVYNLPPGLPIPSETRLMEWKNHIIWTLAFYDCGQVDADALGRRPAINQAIGAELAPISALDDTAVGGSAR